MKHQRNSNSTEENHPVKSFIGFFNKLSPPDIYDAVYVYSSEEMNILSAPSSALQKKGLVTRLMAFVYWFAKETHCWLVSKTMLDKAKLKNKVIFFYSSINEKKAIESIALKTNDGITVSTQISEKNKINFIIPYLLAIIYAPWVLLKYLVSSGYQQRSYSYALDQYLFSCGYTIYLRFVLTNNRPALAVVSNDHSMLSRTFALVCRELNVPVAYIQHASVSEKFPKFMFNFAFLDGIDALEKYEKKGLGSCVVFLSGISKLDDALTKLHHSTIERNCILICPNPMDEVIAVVTAIAYIKENIDQKFNVCLRPHPGDKRRFALWREKAKQIGVTYSESDVECSSDLIIKSAIVIAADSNILLEAALLNAFPISMPFAGEILDHYGFIRKGVALYAKNPEEVVSLINSAEQSHAFYQAAKHFSHIVNTEYEGWSSELIAQTLNELAHAKKIPNLWHLYSKNVYAVT